MFQASVATRSPSLMPSRSRRLASRSARAWICRVVGGVNRAFDRARDDRAFAVIGVGVVDDAVAAAAANPASVPAWHLLLQKRLCAGIFAVVDMKIMRRLAATQTSGGHCYPRAYRDAYAAQPRVDRLSTLATGAAAGWDRLPP